MKDRSIDDMSRGVPSPSAPYSLGFLLAFQRTLTLRGYLPQSGLNRANDVPYLLQAHDESNYALGPERFDTLDLLRDLLGRTHKERWIDLVESKVTDALADLNRELVRKSSYCVFAPVVLESYGELPHLGWFVGHCDIPLVKRCR